MAQGLPVHDYKDILIFLAAAGIVVPLFSRLRISPVLGFLAAGAILGPYGLGRLAGVVPGVSILTLSDARDIQILADFGVVFLLFMIGLELSWERLKSMRRMVFGLGMSQVALSAVLVALIATAFGQPPLAATVFGLALALSSTALVVPVLAERKRLQAASGRAAFAILLAQDLAAAAILASVGLMAGAEAGESWTRALFTLAPAAAVLGALVFGGRVVLRPMFRSVARAKSPELFVAASLLVVIGTGVAASLGGLSMALGAFIAGLLLAETEFRREVEVVIEPFKGLLLGMFFVSVGAGLDLGEVAAEPVLVLAVTFGVIAVKTLAIFGLGRLFKLPARPAFEAGLVLGPGGEFAFVVIGQAMASRLVGHQAGEVVLVATTVGFFLTPALAGAAERIATRVGPEEPLPPALAEPPEPAGDKVLIVGYGRVGRLVGQMLTRHDIGFVAIDSDTALVAAAREAGQIVYYGDAARAEFLRRCGIETIPALVVTMDAPLKVDEVVKTARALRPNLTLIARARDARHAARLYALGATDAVPETVEASLQLAENTLIDLGVPMGLVIASIHEKRDEFRQLFQDNAPQGRRTRALRRTARHPTELF
jgi:CPA2 family monovalent cation:H+ antiporter-2